MIKVERFFNGILIVGPVIIGALLSGVFYLAKGSLIPLTIFQLALILSFGMFFFMRISTQNLSIEGYGLEKWYLLFMALIFFSIIYTPEKEQALFYAIRFVVLLLMTYLIYNSIYSYREIEILCFIVIGTSLIIAMINMIQTYINPEIAAFNFANQGRKLIRQSGGERDPNVFASNFILPIMLVVSFFTIEKSRFKRLLFFLGNLLLLVPVMLSYSRSSWIAIGIGIVIILFYQKKFDYFIYIAIVFILILFSSETIQNLTFSILERLGNIFAGTKDDSSKFRIILAITSVYMLLDTYLIGVGFQGFSTAFQKYHPPQTTIGIYEPHNDFYAIYAELGITGFIIFLTIIYLIYKRGKNNLAINYPSVRIDAIAIALFASFISYMIFCQFISGIMYNSIFMILLSLIFCLNKLGCKIEPEVDIKP